MTHSVLERLADPDPAVRHSACAEAAEDPAATLFSEALAGALGDPDRTVARAASDALVEIGRRVGGVDEALRDALHGESPEQRFGAANTWSRLAPPETRLLPAAVEALGSHDGDVRWAAARILVATGRLHAEVLPLLAGLVREDPRPRARRMCAFALRSLAPERPEAAAALLTASRDDEIHVRRAAYTAMAALIAPPAAIPERLLDALGTESDPNSRRIAAHVLGQLGEAGVPLPDGARAALESARRCQADPNLMRAAERALERLQTPTAPHEEMHR